MATNEEMSCVLSLFPVDTQLMESYKGDALARSLKQLASSLIGSTLYVTEKGYILHDSRVYVPFTEAERIFYEIYNEEPGARYAQLVSCFTAVVYSPEVTREDMRRWFRYCQNVTLDTRVCKANSSVPVLLKRGSKYVFSAESNSSTDDGEYSD